MADAIRCSAWRSSWKSAGVPRSSVRRLAARERLERGAGPVGTEILADRVHQVLDRDRGAPAAEVRRGRRQLLRHEQVGLQMLDRRGLPQQRDDDIGHAVERQTPEHAVHQRRHVEAEQRLRFQRRRCRTGPDGASPRRSAPHRQSSAGTACRSRPGSRRSCRRARRPRCPGARTGRRRRRARTGRRPRTRAGRSRRAARRRTGDSRNTPAAGCRRSRRAASSAAGSPTFWLSAGEAPLRCSTSGMTMWFETMIASATHSTITIAVAADRPPMNTATVNSGEPPASGSASTNMSLSIAAHRKHDQPGERDRDDEQVDGDQVEREQPARAPHLDVAVLSTTPTWNCRGSSTIAKNDSSVITAKLPQEGAIVHAPASPRRSPSPAAAARSGRTSRRSRTRRRRGRRTA